MLKQITIAKVEKVASGTNKSGEWTLSKVTDSIGFTYTTFADFRPFIGKEVEVIDEPNTSKNAREGDRSLKLPEVKAKKEEGSTEGMLILKSIQKDLAEVKAGVEFIKQNMK